MSAAASPQARKVCVVTGSRADYGYLAPLMRALAEAEDFRLQVVATGMHLAPEFGHTVDAILADGFVVDARAPGLEAGDTGLAAARSIGNLTASLAEALERLEPDLVVLLGDRFEILAAAQAALVTRRPVAHLAGGDVTEGAFDEAIRHAVTKMAHLHFPTNEDARDRLLQLGEDPARVHLVGATSLDAALASPRADRAELEAFLGLPLEGTVLLVTFHPVTLDPTPGVDQLREVLAGLDRAAPESTVVVTLPNADPEGRALAEVLEAWAAARARTTLVPSLGQRRYYGMLALADAVVGNSSSGLYEAPTFQAPTVNVGARQRGRPRAASVVDVEPERGAVAEGLRRALERGRQPVENPYGDGQSVPRILAALRAEPDLAGLLQKRFHPWPERPTP